MLNADAAVPTVDPSGSYVGCGLIFVFPAGTFRLQHLS
jgi:hypothetical protein